MDNSMVTIFKKKIELDISGLGIIFYSPLNANHIKDGEDYLSKSYTREEDVQSHIQKGTIVGFGTESPGKFNLEIFEGYPSNSIFISSEFKLRLGLNCIGRKICFRDLYDLMEWHSSCPEEQILELNNGIYRITLCSNAPSSGILGDDQMIKIYFEKLNEFPKLSTHGIPTLCV
jgi:hypothetical protein